MERRATLWNGTEDFQSFSVVVTCDAPAHHGTLLKIVATLHRRGIDLESASLTTVDDGRRCFRAAFAATPGRAETVRRTLRNLIGVAEVVLVEAGD